MGVLLKQDGALSSYIRKEVELPKTIKKGLRGQGVRRVQEWLNLHELRLVVDGVFGPVTHKRVQQFQKKHGLGNSGIVSQKTWEEMVAPLTRVLTPIRSGNHMFSEMVLRYAKLHLTQNPKEVGGKNGGPWVRLYMDGNDGALYAWCAGFVTFILRQAAETLQISTPIKGSWSCDSLAHQGMNSGIFIKELDLKKGRKAFKELSKPSIFLVRKTSTDWTHTGFAMAFDDVSFATIEGNTNDEGHREGFEVCARERGYKDKDFIVL